MSNGRMDRGPSRNYSIGLGKSSGSNTTRFVPNAPTSTGCDGISFSTTNATHRRWGQLEIEAFLTHLALAGNVARSTQTQAFNALLLLSREVLGLSLDDAGIHAMRAHKQGTLPVVLTKDEVQRVLVATHRRRPMDR